MMFLTRAIVGIAFGLMVLVMQEAALPESTSTESTFTASMSSNDTNGSMDSTITVKISSNENISSSIFDVVAVTTPANFTTESTTHVETLSNSISWSVSTSTAGVDVSTLLSSLNMTAADNNTGFEEKHEKLNDTEFTVNTAVQMTSVSHSQYFRVGLTTSRSLNLTTTEGSSPSVEELATSETILLKETTVQLENFNTEMSTETSHTKSSTEESHSTSISAVDDVRRSSSLLSTTVSSVSTAESHSTTVSSFSPSSHSTSISAVDDVRQSSSLLSTTVSSVSTAESHSMTVSSSSLSSVISVVSSSASENDKFNIHLASLTADAVTVPSVSAILMSTSKVQEKDATTASVDVNSSAISIGLGVIFSLIGLAAILVAIVVLRNRLSLCRHINYRKQGSDMGLPVTYTAIENGNYIGPSCSQPEKSNFATDAMIAVVDRHRKLAATPRPSNASLPDELMLLPTGCGDISLDETGGLPHDDTEWTTALVNENKDELDQPVLLDIDSFFARYRVADYNYASNEPGQSSSDHDGYNAVDVPLEIDPAACTCAEASGSDQLHPRPSCHNHNNAGGRPFHEYDPVYVPRHDAASMARRVDESSYVRTPRARRSADPYEEVQSEQPRPHRPLPSPITVVLPDEVGPAPVAPPRVASAGRSAAVARERRALPPVGVDNLVTEDHRPPVVSNTRQLEVTTTGSAAEATDSPYEAVVTRKSIS